MNINAIDYEIDSQHEGDDDDDIEWSDPVVRSYSPKGAKGEGRESNSARP